MQPRFLRIVALLAILGVASAAETTCGTSAVCADVSSSLSGEIIISGVRVTWSSDDENAQLAAYKIKRYDCGTPDTCSVLVTTITHTGSCGTNEPYSYTDYPPAPVSSWTYTVEVIKSDNSRACAIDVIPQ